MMARLVPVKVYATPRKFMIAWGVSFACMLGLTGTAMFYANNIDRQSNQAWCELISGLDERYQALPPDADIEAKEFAAKIHSLRMKLDC